jgi:pimeloyl-ACP methyl ester carboxylesterase
VNAFISSTWRLRASVVATIAAMSVATLTTVTASGPGSRQARHSGTPAGPSTSPSRAVTTSTGTLPDGATWIIQVPEGWNGILLLFGHGLVPPGQPNPAVEASDPITASYLLNAGYALAGSSFATTGFAVDEALRDQIDLVDVFTGLMGRPRATITWGASMGGLIATALAERAPDRIDGALSLCGVLDGGVGLWNTYLDMLFAVKTLIAPDAPIALTKIDDPFASIQALVDALTAAQATPEGRARIALAAALGHIPGWTRADQPEPDPDDFATQEANQFEILRSLTIFLGIVVRADLEARAGGNPSFNAGVDYTSRLYRSSGRREVLALYRRAGVSLADDLRTLAAAPRITADPSALHYLAETTRLDGRLSVPVFTVHNVADPLAPVEHEQAYAATVRRTGAQAWLRQAFVNRAGHCIFTPAETVAALQVVIGRVESGHWGPGAYAHALNLRAASLGPALNAHLDEDTGLPVATPPAFVPFHPSWFLRPLWKLF